MLAGVIVALFGLFFAAIGGYKYAISFSNYTDEYGSSLDFDPDTLIILVVGILLVIIGLTALYLSKINKHSNKAIFGSLIAVNAVACIYYLSRLIKLYTKHKNVDMHWAYFSITLALLAVGIGAYFLLFKVLKVEEK